MEQFQIPENAIIVTTITNPNDEPKPIRKRKNGGPMHVLKVALLKMRGGGNKKTGNVLPVDDDSKNVWRKVVGSMRPLHLQDNQSPRSKYFPKEITMLPPPSPSESIGGSSAFTDFHDEESYTPSPLSSAYASAVGLNELVQSDEEADQKQEAANTEESDGDEKIDAKAEEFIAQFYQQMRLQRLNKVNRHYEERSQRSLG